jgi:hypothetical protein
VTSAKDANRWAQRLLTLLQESPRYGHALRKVSNAGIADLAPVLLILWEYTSPQMVEKRRAASKSAKQLRKQLRLCAAALNTTSNLSVNAMRLFALAGSRLAYQLVERAQTSIAEAARTISKVDEDLGSITSERGEARDEELLVMLLLEFEARTHRPLYSVVATLIELASRAHRITPTQTARSLKESRARYKKKHSMAYELMEYELRDAETEEESEYKGRSNSLLEDYLEFTSKNVASQFSALAQRVRERECL